MLEKVQKNIKNKLHFIDFYNEQCILLGICPLKFPSRVNEGILEINYEKVAVSEWKPLLQALRSNKNLKMVSIWNSSKKSALGKISSLKEKNNSLKSSNQIILQICETLVSLLRITFALQSLQFRKLKLNISALNILKEGLITNTTLKYLSFAQCALGDSCCEAICDILKRCTSIIAVNFSECNLTWKSAKYISVIISHQAMLRHQEIWHGSLRSQNPDLDVMRGLRWLDLHGNPSIQDKGAKFLADALRDDLWIKGINMQNCGLTDEGGWNLLSVMNNNDVIEVLDINNNLLQNTDLITKALQYKDTVDDHHPLSKYKWFIISENEAIHGKTEKLVKSLKKNFNNNSNNDGLQKNNRSTFTEQRRDQGVVDAKEIKCEVPSEENSTPLLSNKNMSTPICKKCGSVVEKMNGNKGDIAVIEQLQKNANMFEMLYMEEKAAHTETERKLMKVILEKEDLWFKLKEKITDLDQEMLKEIEMTFIKFQEFLSLLHNIK